MAIYSRQIKLLPSLKESSLAPDFAQHNIICIYFLTNSHWKYIFIDLCVAILPIFEFYRREVVKLTACFEKHNCLPCALASERLVTKVISPSKYEPRFAEGGTYSSATGRLPLLPIRTELQFSFNKFNVLLITKNFFRYLFII